MPQKILDAFLSSNIETNSAEKIMQTALKKLQIKHYVYRPFLVQHLDDGSLMNHDKKEKRRSIFFIDYLDELNINYNSLFLAHNPNYKEVHGQLKKYMIEKFKDIDK